MRLVSLFGHMLSFLDIVFDVIVDKGGAFARINVLPDDESGNECIFFLFLKVLLDHFGHIVMFLLFYGMQHLMLEILFSFLLSMVWMVAVLNAIVMIDFLVHAYDFILELDHQVV